MPARAAPVIREQHFWVLVGNYSVEPVGDFFRGAYCRVRGKPEPPPFVFGTDFDVVCDEVHQAFAAHEDVADEEQASREVHDRPQALAASKGPGPDAAHGFERELRAFQRCAPVKRLGVDGPQLVAVAEIDVPEGGVVCKGFRVDDLQFRRHPDVVERHAVFKGALADPLERCRHNHELQLDAPPERSRVNFLDVRRQRHFLHAGQPLEASQTDSQPREPAQVNVRCDGGVIQIQDVDHIPVIVRHFVHGAEAAVCRLFAAGGYIPAIKTCFTRPTKTFFCFLSFKF